MKHALLFTAFSILSVSCATTNSSRRPSSVTEVDWDSAACKDFVDFTLKHSDEKDGFNTDGLVIQKDGNTVYEFYDGDPRFGGNADKGLYLQNSPHSLWSASKTITGTLIGRAINDGITFPNGEALTLNTRLHDIFPMNAAYANLPNSKHYNAINVEHLVQMGSNFTWNESYESDIRKSTFLPMLYFKKGNQDMLSYALRAPQMPEGPGKRWNYSGGNSMMLMGILRKAYGDEAFKNLPWSLLFDRLDMSGVVFERDGKGNFIGNSYVNMRPLDMAKVGALYLNDGMYEGKRLLSTEWVKAAQEVSPPVKLEATPLETIEAEGVYGARTFWLNQTAQGYGPEFPNSPKDLYFAAGHYGQLIVVLPTQRMVIARTGHDVSYWKKIDPFVSKAVACVSKEAK